ncbi:replication initiation negative regulator SeqA [Shewanella inventionis]|uniref:Negative modulator of initiation of replication n=1 Tax=Shewanella inventionis TaxID=1738770 RepID=A0ABQ1J9Q2_9GAMM|nr:replication initiation negative regulator SeqA [Shewanella inventionis]MCL1157796.1 replication initiation negative regulator SeqA [Shewanella inventionis]UAL41637.1 replication initiation negative regulator SeqA [Shewanella inventionis]GGB63241.1 negative modulator of initiation of replication [Shewanella inventionis]
MKYIEIDEELYRYIASKTERIGESASDILRRLLHLSVETVVVDLPDAISEPSLETEPKPVSDAQSQRSQLFNQAKAAVEKVIADQASPDTKTESEDNTVVIDFKSIVNEHLLAQQKGAVGRFMFLLGNLQAASATEFNKVLDIQGKGRLYFARSKQALLDSSQSSNPKEIGASGFWVTTNNNTAKKQTILTEVLVHLGCDSEKARIIAQYI